MQAREYKKSVPYTAFTLTARDGLLREILVPIKLKHASVVSIDDKTMIDANAIWDTGATHSVISRELANKMSLKPISMSRVNGVHGLKEVPTYTIDLILNNKIRFDNINVTEGELSPGKVDFLIGMNIIALGDSSITQYVNKRGQACSVFSFQYPSTLKSCDYVQKVNQFNAAQLKHIQNQKNIKRFKKRMKK